MKNGAGGEQGAHVWVSERSRAEIGRNMRSCDWHPTTSVKLVMFTTPPQLDRIMTVDDRWRLCPFSGVSYPLQCLCD